MDELKSLRIESKQAVGEISELISRLNSVKQSNQQKYEIIRPFFERLNLYCDSISLRFERDKDLFAIPLASVKCAEVKEDTDILFILFNNNNLHELNLHDNTHTIFIIKEKHNCIFEFFINIYNRIRFICYRLKLKTIKYIKNLINN